MKVLVTGPNGLAGAAITSHLAGLGYEVVPAPHKLVELRNPEQTTAFFADRKPDIVVHTAATVYGLQGNMDNQAKSLYDNTLINTNVIHAAHLVGTTKVIAMGSNCIYPAPPVLPYRVENIFEGRPDTGEYGYGHAKRHMLATLEAYKDSYGLDFSYLVSGNLYGPNDTFNTETGHVMPSLIKKFYDACDPSQHDTSPGYVNVWGDGSTTRDFLYSKDLARIVDLAIRKPAFTGPVNIGSGQTASIEYVCKRLCSISGLDYSNVIYDTSKPKGRPNCYADLNWLWDLGFSPAWRLAEGLKETYDWYAAKRQSSPAA